jgi:hypothetical protein
VVSGGRGIRAPAARHATLSLQYEAIGVGRETQPLGMHMHTCWSHRSIDLVLMYAWSHRSNNITHNIPCRRRYAQLLPWAQTEPSMCPVTRSCSPWQSHAS